MISPNMSVADTKTGKFLDSLNIKSGKVKKKKFRGKGKKSKSEKETSVKLPEKSEDFSSNWKKLLTKIESNPKKAKKKLNKVMPSTTPKKTKEVAEPKKPEIWFDDVDPELLDPEDRPEVNKVSNESKNLVKEKSFKGLTKALAMDCEMVGVNLGGKDSILARASLVNQFGHCVYDKFVKPTDKVTDYRTKVSGIRPNDIKNGEEFKIVQKEISDMLQGRVLVGHSIKHDLKVLYLDHPKKMIRDTSVYKPFRASFGGKTPSLKNLTARMVGVTVQDGEHSSVQDAQATMRLYTMYKKQWETEINQKRIKNAEHRFAGSKKVPKNKKEESTNSKSNGKERLQYQDSSDDSD